MGATKTPPSVSVGRNDLSESPKEERLADEPCIGMALAPRRPQVRVQARARNQVPASLIMAMICLVATGYYEVSRTNVESRVIACVEAQLAEPLREDRPILGIEFDELPPGAFGAPIGFIKWSP